MARMPKFNFGIPISNVPYGICMCTGKNWLTEQDHNKIRLQVKDFADALEKFTLDARTLDELHIGWRNVFD